MIDPYHQWLGIPKDQRPPTHYQLLGLSFGEKDRLVIQAAAVRQSAYVRNFQAGQFADMATRILNEIAEARTVLSDPEKQAAYDSHFRGMRVDKKVEKKPEAAPIVPDIPKISKALVEVEEPKPKQPRPEVRRPMKSMSSMRRRLTPGQDSSAGLQVFVGTAAVFALGFVAWLMLAPAPKPKPKTLDQKPQTKTESIASNDPAKKDDSKSAITTPPATDQAPQMSERARNIKMQQEAFDASVKQLEQLMQDISEQAKADNGLADYRDKIEEARDLREKEKIEAMIATAKKIIDADRPKNNPPAQENPPAAENANTNSDPIQAILRDIRSADSSLQKTALEQLVLAKIVPEKKEDVAETLNRLLEASETNKSTVVKALGYWGNENSAELLCRICDQDQKAYTKDAMRALAKLKFERGVKAIYNRLWDRADSAEAAIALKDIGSVAEKQVWDLLKNKDYEVRGAGCEILASIGTSESLPKIRGLLNDKDRRVKEAAQSALNKITHRDTSKDSKGADNS